MLQTEIRTIGGSHPETAAMRNALAVRGVRHPGTGEPLSEALVLGIGGGMGGGYFFFEFGDTQTLMLGVRHLWQSPDQFLLGIAERLGVPVRVHETNSARAAAANLEQAIGENAPAIAFVDLARLRYISLPARCDGYWYHVVRVVGAAGDDLLIDDRAPVPWRVTRESFATARGAVRSYKSRLIVLEGEPPAIDLAVAVSTGIHAGLDGLFNPPIKNFGLSAFAKWLDLIDNAKDKKGWPRVLPPSQGLYRALFNVYHWIETAGTGGGAMRPLYGAFLDEAAGILDRPALAGLADRYRAQGGRWSALAAAALPAPALAETRRLMTEKARLIEQVGQPATSEIEACQAELNAIDDAMTEFPLAAGECRDLFAELRSMLVPIVAEEVAMAEDLRSIMA